MIDMQQLQAIVNKWNTKQKTSQSIFQGGIALKKNRIGRSGNSNAQDEKGKATGADEVRLEMLEMAG